MPMGPPGGGGKLFNGHQQQHNNEGDGEVKKIYLLQPVPRVQPMPQLKGGGYMGPVQTHIHVPAPVVQHSGKSHHGHARPNGGFNDGHEEGAKMSQAGGGSYHHHHSDMKILPIVVIPPIAPIHVPHDSKKGGGEQHHDHRSFSNYGGSVGGSTYRKAFGPRGALRSSQLDQSFDAMDQFGFAASRSRSSRNRDEDYGDDYETSPARGPLKSRYHHQQQRQAPSSASGRRWSSGSMIGGRRKVSHSDGYSRSAGSIRDIIDQQRQVVFDDDGEVNSGSSSRQSVDCCREPRSRYQADNSLLMDAGRSDHRELASRARDSSYGESTLVNEESNSIERDQRPLRQASADLSSLFYDRELQPTDELPTLGRPRDHAPLLGRYDGGMDSLSSPLGRRKFLDSSNLLEDDEWAFDSVKSVSHVGFSPNATTTSNQTNTTTTTSSTTTAPLPLIAGQATRSLSIEP